ncbi:MAG TPA: glycoside hydrolase family 76 protein [Polyangiaceae bacterium]
MRAQALGVRSLAVPLLFVAASALGCSGGAGSSTGSPGAEPDAEPAPTTDAGIDGPGSRDAPTGADDAPAPPPKDAATDAPSQPPPDLGPAGDFESYAKGAADALQALYDPSTGLFPSTGWWNSANAITALVDTMARTGSMAYASDLCTTLAKNSGSNFINQYYDDEGWWALAWIDAYDLTKDTKYLSMAKTIFADLTTGWDSTCGGGLWWSKARSYKNAIPNELFLEVAVRLHARTPGDGGAGSFIDWADREWKWFDASGMINAQNLVNDGLTSACKNNAGATWTYNQGVLIGGLVDLAASNHDPSLLTRAQAIADAAMGKLVDDVGVLHEPCEPSCGGDGTQFKGIFMRHLFELAKATSTARDVAFITKNADWVWNAARNAKDDLGLSWSQALDAVDASRQSSALDALNAAIPWNAPATNLALHKSATANGTCATDQTAAQGDDGSTATKWCAGATNGAYWIVVDLGAEATVSRIIVRHAGAGGENAGWNTKDFTLSASTDGKTYAPVATVKGNTRSVTIHRFAPVSAQYLRMDITAPQTDPQYPAARVYEIEAYER